MLHWLKSLCIWILLYSLTMFIVPLQAAEIGRSAATNCDVHHGSCIQTLSNIQVTFEINPKPVKAMMELNFKITLKGKQPEASPYIDLGMPGMEMGPNRVSLQPMGKGTYQGTGIIVRCPSGKKIWIAKITLPDIGKVEFIFDVIY
ncbi:MAG: hypothetical protein JSW04_03200 [Desulfobacterales bacterium]|nr:MAG: hypothetical protein JSW04_03200 [Desulfobacterales bacterium]